MTLPHMVDLLVAKNNLTYQYNDLTYSSFEVKENVTTLSDQAIINILHLPFLTSQK